MPGGFLSGGPSRRTTLPKTRQRVKRYRTVHTRRRNPSSKMTNKVRNLTYNNSFQIQKGPSPFANRFYVNQKWSYISGLTSPSSNITGIVSYRVNGPYDPDVGAGGGQPQYWDQLSALYTNYRCVGALVKLRFTNPSQAGYFGGYRIRRAGDTSSTGISYDDFKVQRFAEIAPLSVTGSQKLEYKVYVKPNVIYGETKETLMDDNDYQSAVATLPTKQVYIDVVAYSPKMLAISANFEIEVNYNFCWTGLKYTADA